jgi:hypothetical protein
MKLQNKDKDENMNNNTYFLTILPTKLIVEE